MDKLNRILFVDDSERDTELALEALSEYNLANEVTVLRDGSDALDYLFRRGAYADREEGEPVVILLDLKMPKVNGIEVLQAIKTDAKLKVIPVVVMTSSREESDLSQCYQLGVNAYVVKPVRFAEFLEAVRQIGAFWALLNDPPPGSIRDSESAGL
ncbi:MAG: response regulator [Fimbriimonas sp.]|nr:response regulator [Fimbriimonas sp.]